MKEIFSYFLIAAASQGFLLSFTLFTRRVNHRANKYLATFILCTSFILLWRFFWAKELFSVIVLMEAVILPCMGLIGPLIYLYSLAMTNRRIDKRRMHYHFLPSLLMMIFYSILISIYFHPISSWGEFRKFIHQNPIFFSVPLYMDIITVAGFIYAIKAWRNVRKYQSHLKDFVSDVQKAGLQWLNLLLLLVLASFIISNIMHLLFILTEPPTENKPPVLSLFFMFIQAFTIIFTAYYALRQPDLFQYLPSEGEVKAPQEETSPRYEKQSISPEQMQYYREKLERYMKEKRPWLEEDLTLVNLASRLEIPAHHLSMTFTLSLGKNFYQYINSYRINEAKRLLSEDAGHTGLSILEAAYQAGFRSKSTFNKIFKEMTGETPTAYRERLILPVQ